MSASRISRRHLLAGGAGLAVGAAAFSLSGCAPQGRAGALDSLRSQLAGQLLLPTDQTFAAENEPANDVFANVQPIAIAMCVRPEDVVACVNWCRNEGVQAVVRGGGHSYAGFSTTEGLLIKTTPMHSVTVDRDAGTATVQAGALNKQLIGQLNGTDLMLPIGTCLEVGVAGLVLGGGLGDNSRWAGMTCDHLTSTDLVLANGNVVTANERENPDLFWACRGGAGGNFGVNTTLNFKLVEIPVRQISAFEVRFAGVADCVASFEAFDRLMLTAPERLSGFVAITNLNKPVGGPANKVFPEAVYTGSYIGKIDELRDLISPLMTSAKPTRVEIVPIEFWEAQIDWLAVPKLPTHGLVETAHFTNKALPDGFVNQLIRRIAAAPGGGSSAYCEVRLMCWTGGRVNSVPVDSTAYVHRTSTALLRPALWWQPGSDPGIQAQMRNWFNETLDFIAPHCQPSAFQNWPYRELPNALNQYYGSNLPRLKQVKREVDPSNMFRYQQSIPVG